MHSRLRLLHLLGAGATLASIALAGPASPAGAAPPRGQTLLLDRPSGFGPLPFDGAGPAEIGPHPLSGDAAHRWVVFTSSADSLLGGDDDSLPHVYRLDRVSGAVEQVDTGPGGSPFAAVPVGNGGADVSADGRWVAFVGVTPETLLSLSTVVARADGPAPPDPTVPPIGVYVKDMQSGAIELASRGDGPQGAPAGQTWSAALSGDGRHVAFTAEGVVQTQEGTAPADAHDVYLRDLDDDSTHLVSRTATGRAAGGVDLFDVPAISFRGDAVAYLTDNPATADDRDDGRDAYLARALDGTPRTELLSIDADGAGRALDIALSGDGRLAAWSTDGRVYLATASPAVGRATQVNRAKPGATGGMGDQPAFEPVPDGATAPQRLHFRSGQLDPADRNGQLDLYSAELAHPGDAAFVHLLTSATADRSIDAGAAAGAGSVVVYAAAAPNLPAGHSDFSQVYEHTAGASGCCRSRRARRRARTRPATATSASSTRPATTARAPSSRRWRRPSARRSPPAAAAASAPSRCSCATSRAGRRRRSASRPRATPPTTTRGRRRSTARARAPPSSAARRTWSPAPPRRARIRRTCTSATSPAG